MAAGQKIEAWIVPKNGTKGTALAPTSNTSIPWASEYPDRFQGEYLAWVVPRAAIVPGESTIVLQIAATTPEAKLAAGRVSDLAALPAVVVSHVDVLLPVPAPLGYL